ncbi:hypothetical protein [Opitutus terrae]|uniref:Uncharacterized protein n=1 Tax=Opitutus terrae (strain DSM 11246 / JCM 15787 / PB90-1) TaxID=452637 RepID=B1ZZ60_OPITP|nr:hypothetical protein [Opitutus terrae]ACB77132.1 hypothetical protein Oter_3858 [Opitutus terrae PB90-1]
MNPPPATPASGGPPVIGEVRYSLPQLLEELAIERSSGSFSMEKLDQNEIKKLFKSRTPPRRVKPKK